VEGALTILFINIKHNY